uniref:Uncharacterized protein n=1 Tax=Eutreptiella gymnastica TaxID=73025 RepID=A0A7S1N8H5_9EUGL
MKCTLSISTTLIPGPGLMPTCSTRVHQWVPKILDRPNRGSGANGLLPFVNFTACPALPPPPLLCAHWTLPVLIPIVTLVPLLPFPFLATRATLIGQVAVDCTCEKTLSGTFVLCISKVPTLPHLAHAIHSISANNTP